MSHESRLLKSIARDDYFSMCESIRRGAPANAETQQGWTALLRCVGSGDVERLGALVRLGVDVNYVCERGLGQTPLVMAVSLNDAAMLKGLLAHGADVDKENASGLTPLTMALQLGRVETLAAYLVETACARVDLANAQGHTPLMLCVLSFDLGMACARFLLSHGAPLTSNLVTLAREKRKFTLARFFEEHQFAAAEVKMLSPGPSPASPEPLACDDLVRSHDEEKIMEAIARGALSVDHETPQGETPLIFAARHDLGRMLLRLAQRGARVDFQSKSSGATALLEASRRGCSLAVRLLLHALNADPDTQTTEGYSALMLAAQHGHREIVGLLLGSRALSRQALATGLDARLLALGAHRRDILDLLQAYDRGAGSVVHGVFCPTGEKVDLTRLERQEALVDSLCREVSFRPRKTQLRLSQISRPLAAQLDDDPGVLAEDDPTSTRGCACANRKKPGQGCDLACQAEQRAARISAKRDAARHREDERRMLHKKQLLKECGVDPKTRDPHRHLETLLVEAREAQGTPAASFTLFPVQLQLAKHLIDEMDDPEQGVRHAVALLAAQRKMHARVQADVGGHFGLAAVATLLSLARGTLQLGRARDVERFSRAAVRECLALDRADGPILLQALEESVAVLQKASMFAAAQKLCQEVYHAQAEALGPKNRITKATLEASKRVEHEMSRAREQHRRSAVRNAGLLIPLNAAKAWRERMAAKDTYLALLADREVGWPTFRAYALRRHCHQLVFFYNAVHKALEAERLQLKICSTCSWQLAASLDDGPAPACKFCRDGPLADVAKLATHEVYQSFLRTPLLGCLPPILRKSIFQRLDVGPTCFQPAVDVVVDHLFATIYPQFLRDPWRKHAGYRYIADRFMTADPRVADCVLRIQRWARRHARAGSRRGRGASEAEQSSQSSSDPNLE